jgi:hypothetical protein
MTTEAYTYAVSVVASLAMLISSIVPEDDMPDLTITISSAVVFWTLVGIVVTLVWWGLGYFAINARGGGPQRIPLPWAFVVCGPVGWVCAYLYYCTKL